MIPFWKLHGIGNDFVAIRESDLPEPSPSFIQEICSRNEGVGSDGLLLLRPEHDGSLNLRMWNPDGSESGMCGNGLRCAALWADQFLNPSDVRVIHLADNEYQIAHEGDHHYRVQMGVPNFSPGAIGLNSKTPWIAHPIQIGDQLHSGTAVSFGNPHLVFFVDSDPHLLLPHGRELEHHPEFQNRTNVHFARILSLTNIEMVTWERGAGPTLACGSGACAVAAAAWKLGKAEGSQTLHLPGGKLTISEGPHGIEMTGKAEFTFSSNYPPPV